jgi:colanic acid biosynthesis glycosyl transferase WcaI
LERNGTPEDRPRKRLLVVAYMYLPDQCGGSPINSDLCRELADRGFDVTVRCPYPFYPEWKDKSGQNGFRIRTESEEGVRVERYGLFLPRNPRSLWQRLLHDGSFFLSLSRSLLRGRRFDAVMVFCPLAGGVAFAALQKLVHGQPVWLNVQDLPADAAAASGLSSGGGAQGLFGRIQSSLFNTADVWSSISPAMIDKLVSIRRKDQPVLFMPNWLHTSMAESIRHLPSKERRLPGRPLKLFYSGNIGAKQGLLDFCKLLRKTATPFHFRIHGSGAEADNVGRWIGEQGDERFQFGGLLDEPGYVQVLHDADLYVITEKEGSGASFFPSKMIPGMMSGTPLLAVSDPDSPLGQEMRNEEPGPWFSWDRCHEVPAFLEGIHSEPERFVTWQQNGLRRARAYDRQHRIDELESALLKLMEGQPGAELLATAAQ